MRWKPTPQQLQILREIYYVEDMRNPPSEEIKRITLLLSRFGEIEEKNVFYWFQNQKNRANQRAKRLANTTAAIAAAPRDVQQHATGGSGGYAAKPPKTLLLFPLHGDSVTRTEQDADGSQLSLELSLRPYSPKPN